jgi:excisionase family DNA binding protein
VHRKPRAHPLMGALAAHPTPRPTGRLSRLLAGAQTELERAERGRFRSESSRHWRVTFLQHRIQRLQEALGQWRSGVPRRPAYRIGEAAHLLAVSVKTIQRWVARGRIQARRTAGGHSRFPHAEVERLRTRRRL